MEQISDIETAILGLLYEEPQHGYQLEKTIEAWGMRNWTQIGFSSIYYVLKKLEKKELVKSKLEIVEGKPRKVFTITKEGRKIMKEKIRELLSWNKKVISPFHLGLAYLNYLKPQEVINCLENYLESAQGRMKFLESAVNIQRKLEAPYHVIALYSRPLSSLKTEMEWVKEFIEEIKRKENL